MTGKIKSFTLRACSLLLAAAMIFCLTGCGKKTEAAKLQVLVKDAVKDIYPENTDSTLHVTGNEELKYIAKSGLIEIYIDEKNYSIVVKETLKNSVWYSLPYVPDSSGQTSGNSAAVVSLTVVNGGETLYLNSQDNSVAFGNVSYTAETASVTVHYTITLDSETGKKTEYITGDIAFSVSVKYTLTDGSLIVSCSNENLSGNGNAKIEYLGLLEYFGASSTAAAGDFILVPDGSGALINTAVEQPDFKQLTFNVYGNDAGSSGAKTANTAVIAAYGLKRGESALAVLVQKGDAVASVTADRATGTGGYNRVGARFNMTPVLTVEKKNKYYRYISQNSFFYYNENTAVTNEIKLCMRFVAGANATYSGLASVCREQLIRDKFLSTKTVEKSDYLPFNLTVVGAVKNNIIKSIPVKTTAVLTTFEQAQDMLTRMKSKGVNGIFLRYKGALTGGLNQTDIARADIMLSLGGKNGFTALNKYLSAQKIQLFLDIDLLSTGGNSLSDKSKPAAAITKDSACFTAPNELYEYAGDASFSRGIRTVAGIDKAVLKTLTYFKNTELTGFCVNDACKILYSDYSGDGYNRQIAASEVARQLTSLSTGRKVMADTGNFCAIKNADVIVNMPMPLETSVEENPAYEAVPFIQLIMHGIVDYSGTPINDALNTDVTGIAAKDIEYGSINDEEQKELKDRMLRYIEYGASPCYEWTYKDLEDKTGGVEKFYYDDWINQAVDFYLKANTALSDLRDARMIRHTKIAPGVFCTEYEGSKIIYVNYTGSDFDVGGFTVKKRDFIRIK